MYTFEQTAVLTAQQTRASQFQRARAYCKELRKCRSPEIEFRWWAFQYQARFAQQCTHERDRIHRERVCQFHIERLFCFVPQLGVVFQRLYRLPAVLFVYVLKHVGNDISVE